MREAGILLPLASLPNEFGIGDFGGSAYQFIDCIAAAGVQIWQILPLNPLGYGNSPYQPFSSYAGDDIYISLEKLCEYGLLTEEEKYEVPASDRILYEVVRKKKEPCFRIAYSRFQKDDGYTKFIEKEPWVRDYAVFCTCKKKYGYRCWTEWPEDAETELDEDEICFEMFLQYMFIKQWKELKSYANAKGIHIMGDVPFYVGLDSLDVWKNKENFQLDPQGYPIAVAGVPPDYFSSTGQRWGNPIYDWKKMKEEGYNFWIQRLQYSSDIYDLVRIDHFRAFDTYWKIPASCKTAIEGEWIEGPSYDFFDCLLKASPDIRIIVEDLGDLREEVYDLRDHYGFKGMKILQFAFDPNETNNRFPDRKNMVLYTGTHDNLPIQGWLDLQSADTKATIAETLKTKGIVCEDLAWGMVELANASIADIVIVPVQDILGLDAKARINTPGTVGSPNWEWKLENFFVFYEKLEALSKVLENTGRRSGI